MISNEQLKFVFLVLHPHRVILGVVTPDLPPLDVTLFKGDKNFQTFLRFPHLTV